MGFRLATLTGSCIQPLCSCPWIGGEGGIPTHGPCRASGIQSRCLWALGHFAWIGAVGATRTLNEVSLAGFVDPGPIRLDDDSVVVPLAGFEPAFRA